MAIPTQGANDTENLANQTTGVPPPGGFNGSATTNTNASTSQGASMPNTGIIHERCKQLVFTGIPGYPNPILEEIRKKLPKFIGSNVVTCEEYLKKFIDVIDDYNIVPDDVIMNLFVQSLTKDSRDWFRALRHGSIGSWN